MKVIATILFFIFSFQGLASHFAGGEITWECQGNGQYIFQLSIYRDCNEATITNPLLTLNVWGHPSVTEIDCGFAFREDLSPNCTQVTGGPIELECGSGASAGNGPGAIERVVFISQPVTLNGVPPAEGWAFTYDSFYRNTIIDNIANPGSSGMTIWSKMYAPSNQNGSPCYDSSPQYGQLPLTVTCAGTDFTIEQNVYDADGDSLTFEWTNPLDHFSGTFDPPSNPVPLGYNNGYSFNNPTPDASFDPGNIPSSLDENTGSINFTSNTVGVFAINVLIKAYRNGQLISESSREFQIIVISCPNYNNTAPVITPPFNGNTSYSTTVNAGDLVAFDFISMDLELLQNGSNQSNILTPSGSQFGTNFTDPNTGCDQPPCATLGSGIPIVGDQGINIAFNWQTDCDHLENPDGSQAAFREYSFVFKVSDDYCTVPLTSYATINITVLGKDVVQAPDLTCLQVDSVGDVTVNWQIPSDPTNAFVHYEIHSVQDGLLTTITDINTLSYTHIGAGADLIEKDYFILVTSGCDGAIKSISDTLKTIHLDITDPNNGTVILGWNQPGPYRSEWASHYKLMMEYPAGTWIELDSIPFGTTQFLDTISICEAFLNYQITLEHTSGCLFTSNIQGGDFEDLIKPAIPVINFVSVDTSTSDVTIDWNINPSEDTYGYIVFVQDDFGQWITLDTLFGITNTSYTHIGAGANQGILNYTVSAFDSCFVIGIVPPVYQTSAKAPKHYTMHLEAELQICDIATDLDWTPYETWPDDVDKYEVYFTHTGNPGSVEIADDINGNLSDYTHSNLTRGETFCYYIKAISNQGEESWSNRYCLYIDEPDPPSINYLSTATVTEGNDIEVRVLTEATTGIGALWLERADDPSGPFEQISSVVPSANQAAIYDFSAEVNEQYYYYKISVEDTCGDISTESNIAKTILLESDVNNDDLIVTLAWNAYEGFDGSILYYNIYRGVDGIFGNDPIGTTTANIRAYEDDVSDYLNSQGSICYRVEAVESANSYGVAESAFSNVECAELQALIWIPSGFMKNGINEIFKPVISLFDFTSYEMVIYNRWGSQIFKSNDYNTGWDGTLKNGSIAPETTYVYVITFQDAAGITHKSTGAITFLIAGE